MKAILSYISILFFLCLNTINAQEAKHTIGWAYNIENDESSIYFNDPYDVWAEMKPSIGVELFYLYKVNTYMKFGSYLEITKAEFRVSNFDATRWNMGIQCLGKYPDWILHWQAGAYAGVGIANSEEWDDNYLGTDYGMIMGPALEFKNFGIALNLHAGYSIFSSKGEPEKIWMHDRRLYLKGYYNFK